MRFRLLGLGMLLSFVLLSSTGGTGCRQLLYTCEIEHVAQNPEDLNYITLAELAYPPEEDILAVAQGDLVHSSEEPLWWYEEAGALKTPYCITAGTVEYFADLIAGLRENPQAFPIPLATAGFSYNAAVEHKDTFEYEAEQYSDVYVVSMHLHFDYFCGSLCGESYNMDRVVVLTPEGEVQAIFGDGPPRILFI